MFKKIKEKKELIIIVSILIIAVVTHGYNMFHFPYYESDEGTYMAQAWSLINQGKLAPYTYWYDHAPAGWILIALWTKLTGGFFTFGFSVNSGRVLMLILHALSTFFLFHIAKKLSKSNLAAVISSLVFSLSPLAVFFQRRVLLDNILVFWLLFSLFMIIVNGRKLSHYVISAIAFSFAVLSKESALFFLPAILYIIYSKADRTHINFALAKWLTTFSSIFSLYFLYAFLNGEFFPYGTFLGGNNPHVSLLETMKYQAMRKGGFFLDQGSSFFINFREWVNGGFFIIVQDPTLIVGGIIGTVIISFLSFKEKSYRYLSLLTISYWIFLIRGGEVIGFYIIPLVPFLALCIGLSINAIYKILFYTGKNRLLAYTFSISLLSPFLIYYLQNTSIYKKDQTTNQIQAVKFINDNVSKDSLVLIDNYAFVDLNKSINSTIYIPEASHYYWKADRDIQVKANILDYNWRRIDYILATPQMKYDLYNAGLDLGKSAYDNSTIIQSFNGDGWDLQVKKVKKDIVN